MDHIMQLEHHHNLEETCNQNTAMVVRGTSVSQVAFLLAAIALLCLCSSFAVTLPSVPSRELLAALCSLVTTKKALFILSNIIFLFLAADCRCFFGICSMSPSTTDAIDVTACEPNDVLTKQERRHQEEIDRCGVRPCVSYSYEHIYHNSGDNALENRSEEQGKREAVLLRPELTGLDEDEASSAVTLQAVVVEEPTCVAAQELEKLEIDELNRKFEEFIQSRRIKWVKEEEEALQCQQVNL